VGLAAAAEHVDKERGAGNRALPERYQALLTRNGIGRLTGFVVFPIAMSFLDALSVH
jgi:hypothetical protein